MPLYRYTGPATGLTVGKEEFLLFTGTEVELPECPVVATLVALKRLSPIEPPPSTTFKPTPAPASTQPGAVLPAADITDKPKGA